MVFSLGPAKSENRFSRSNLTTGRNTSNSVKTDIQNRSLRVSYLVCTSQYLAPCTNLSPSPPCTTFLYGIVWIFDPVFMKLYRSSTPSAKYVHFSKKDLILILGQSSSSEISMASLLKLPFELRQSILDLLLVRDHSLQLPSCPCCRRPTYELQPQILRTCKQLHKEGRFALYRRNVIRLSMEDCEEAYIPSAEITSLEMIGARNRALITKIEMHIESLDTEYFWPTVSDYSPIIDLTKRYPELRNVAWVQFRTGWARYRSPTVPKVPTGEFRLLIQKSPLDGATHYAAGQMLQDDLFKRVRAMATASLGRAGNKFKHAYITYVKSTRYKGSAEMAIVLCKSPATPKCCPWADRKHCIQYVRYSLTLNQTFISHVAGQRGRYQVISRAEKNIKVIRGDLSGETTAPRAQLKKEDLLM
jgi:hypothetical protein